MPRKFLAINADDFGASAAINSAVARAHREGILTSASLMVNGAAADEAVRLARAMPSLGVGLHLALTESRATEPRRVPSLVDERGEFGSPTAAGWKYFFQEGARAELEFEVRAQIEKFLSAGLPMDHLNGHHHIHMHPVVFEIVLQCARRWRIPAVRLVRDELGLNLSLDRKRLGYKLSHWAIFGVLGRRARRLASRVPFGGPDRVYGLFQDGRLDREHLRGLLRRLRPGLSEIYCHPSTEAGGRGRRLDEELAALLDPEARRIIQTRGIELTRLSAAVS